LRPIVGALVGLALGLGFGACRVVGQGAAECERVCDFALRCGFLPSSLGGRYGQHEEALASECRRRCGSTADSTEITALIDCLTPATGDACELLECQRAAECVDQSTILADEVLGVATVTIRMMGGALWAAVFVPALCEDASGELLDNHGIADACREFAGVHALVGPGDPRCVDAEGLALRSPLCQEIDCETHRTCDPSMCSTKYAEASADCEYYGIEEVQLGYIDDRGVLQLSAKRLTCPEASAGERFEAVPRTAIAPVALFRGTLTARASVALGFPEDALVGRPFCWASSPLGPRRQARAGESTQPVPTPSLTELIDLAYERDREFPVGCGCLLDPIGCEVGDACANLIDDDEDGLVDAEDYGCRPQAEQECHNGIDDDGDGRIDAGETASCD
jgi:hypothetical protein